jgi:GNAT superfamily N-acetyltransferase
MDVKVKTKKEQVIDLWKNAFGDPDAFMHLYFDNVYRDENALVIEKDGKVLSSLQMLPYTMTFYGEEVSVAYISGACTAPSEQGKGLMRQLLQDAFREMQQRNIALSALIPADKWLFNYYRSQGYTEVFEFSVRVYTRQEYVLPEKELIVLPIDDDPDDDIYAFFDKKLRERPICMLHTHNDLVDILEDLRISGGTCFAAYTPDRRPVGIAFALSPTESSIPENVSVKEILFENEKVRQRLLFDITKYYGVWKAIYRIPFYDGGFVTYPYGMARVMDRERLIRIWREAHPGSNRVSVAEMERMDIRALTSCLFDYPDKTAYMSLMLD